MKSDIEVGRFEFKGFNVKVIGTIEKNKPYIYVIGDIEVKLPVDILV
jgi:hypothetical protein